MKSSAVERTITPAPSSNKAPFEGITKLLEGGPAIDPSESEGITNNPCKTRVPFLTHSAFLRFGSARVAGAVLSPSDVLAPNNLNLL